MDQPHQKSRFIKWALIIGIVIVLNLFFNYAISLVYPSPDFNQFCAQNQIMNQPASKQECLSVGGQWTENSYPQPQPLVSQTPGKVVMPTPTKPVQVTGYCNATFTCGKNYDAAYKIYSRTVFLVLVILGVISLLFGLFLKTSEAVTIALSFGGVLSLIIASIRYWSQAENVLKVGILAVALIALIWVGIKKFS